MRWNVLEYYGSRKGQVTCSFQHGNKLSGAMQSCKFFYYLMNFSLFKKNLLGEISSHKLCS